MPETHDLDDLDIAVLAALETGATHTQIAKSLGVDPATIYRRLAKPQMRAAVAARRRQAWHAAIARLREAAELENAEGAEAADETKKRKRHRPANTASDISKTGKRLAEIERRLHEMRSKPSAAATDTPTG